MQDPLTQLRQLKRPPLLIRAARIGLADYRRERDLARLLGLPRAPGPSQAVIRLLEEEATEEALRVEEPGRYSVTRHVGLVIALMAEAQLLAARNPRLVRSA